MQVYGEGKEVGRVNYDSLTGGLNMNKFIRTEAKLIEVVSELFPGKK